MYGTTVGDGRASSLVGVLGLLAGVSCWVFAGVALLARELVMLEFFTGYALVYTTIVLLQRRGHALVAGWLMYLAFASGITLLACLLGRGSFVEIMFLLLPAFPYFVLPIRRRSVRIAFALVPITCLVVLQISDYGLLPPLGLAGVGFELVRWPLLTAAFFAVIAMLEIGERERARAITAAAELAVARKQAELSENLRQTQKLESLGVLAGGIAHDFNNLLTGVLGNASLLAEELEPNSLAAECAADIQAAASAAAELCRQMLAYAGRGQLSVGPLELGALVRDTTGLLSLSVAKTARLELELCDTALTLRGDATQLRQVIMNLVMNASDALGPDGGHVRVRTWLCEATRERFDRCVLAPTEPHGEFACIEVADDGCGMDANTLARLFEPFFSTKATGRGLGLSAVLGIVQAHAGGLAVESEPGHGTRFLVYLPIDAHASIDGRVADERVHLRLSGRALVVDDDAHVRTLVARALTRLGLDVHVLADGNAAIELLREAATELALVVLDVNMPGRRGDEVLAVLREHAPRLPVILASGYDEFEAQRSVGSDGYVECLAKPFAVEQLEQAIARLLAR
jgi:signal transduction histidine kinase/CheY-like chemotaxis protein